METNQSPATGTSIAPPARKTVRKVAKKVSKKAAPAKVAKKSTGEGIALKTLLGKVKMEGKLARRKLRAAGLSFHDPKARWTFTPAQAEKALEVLRA